MPLPGDKFSRSIRLAEEGNLEEVKEDLPGIYLRHKSTLESLAQYDTEDLDNSCGIWISGPPRSGKDFAVRQLADLYVKPATKWWCGYKGERNILISDLDPSHAWMGSNLKIWADRYPFVTEIKGASMKIRPKRLFVTSNFRLDQIFSGQILLALQERFDSYLHDQERVTVTKRKQPRVRVEILSALRENEPGFSGECSTSIDPGEPEMHPPAEQAIE